MASATLIALFLLSALTFYAPSTTAQPVKDWNGNIDKNGGIFGTFYILPSLLGAPGGVRLLATGNEPFPVSVVQSPFKDDKGLPVTISRILQSTYSPAGQAVALSFDYTPGGTSLLWTAVEGFPEGTLVKIDGYYPDPLKGFFYIRDSKFGLKDSINLSFCRSLIGVIPACSNVTVVKSDGNLLLAFTQEDAYDFRLEEYQPPSADA
ncbi:chymotrypsin inhibitor 3-like [Vigna radiata var. radiata]|uniref:Chymotrypsin inhibitor 3-like n=1 Tax=Vigna radiata var. radiata TaxID=3916 RepID=A0A1S3TEA6_VIGRR|nr:chymotrypsin inhibitor 3-like [Vigna radiata var. radiata]